MSTAYYIKIDGIPGECREEKHVDWMQVEHIHFGVRQSVAHKFDQGGNINAGQADFDPITIRMNIDKSYPKLAEAVWLGKHIAKAQIDCTRQGGDKHIYLTYKLTDLAVSSIDMIGNAAGDDVAPMVEFKLVYKQIENTYFPTKLEGGGVAGSVPTGFNQATRKSV